MIMVAKRSLPVQVILQVAFALAQSDGDFTLVQYLSSQYCSSDRYVCQPLILGQCTHLKSFRPHGAPGTDIYTKLTHDHDGEYKVQSCDDPTCNCKMTQDFTLDMCQGSGTPSGGSSRMLAEGKIPGCSRNDIDVALGGWHDRYEAQGIQPGGKTSKAKPPAETGGDSTGTEESKPSQAAALVASGGLKPKALKEFRQRMRDAREGKPPSAAPATAT
eukprot:gnl/MRDRNA2_/MRDRNA2_30079_c0_seq1.p1 gnl/MRDRNA2_/MRDRNA2_30079_c0~~gnl/MRDRNA2_/MRDRNA2_30079_c0_seq1.p1  ORF type:complete len:217 (-),score=37.62 gnl/MRDRNA2_/MRDRNA2_30079_c0_seq1:56-706(-)